MKVLSPSQVRSEEARVDVYCYVALSDLTSVVEERCHGGQTYWDMCLCQFFLGGLLHLEKASNCQDFRFFFCLYLTLPIIKWCCKLLLEENMK